jgi:hypothetical protein
VHDDHRARAAELVATGRAPRRRRSGLQVVRARSWTSGTGAAGGNHDIISWTFVDTFAPIGTAPEPGSTFLVGVALAAIALVYRRRRARESRLHAGIR